MPQPEVYCGNCRTPNPYGMQYCRKCGALLNYTQPVQGAPGGQPPFQQPLYPQQPYPPPQPYQQPYAAPEQPSNDWMRWALWITLAVIAAVLCAGLGLAVYALDPFGMLPSATPLPTHTAPPPALTATAAPIQAPTLLPTFTPYPTYTPYPTLEPSATQAAPTKAAELPTKPVSPTPTEEEFKFSEAAVSIPEVKYGGCGPSSVDFSVKVSSRKDVLAIVLFTRLMDPATKAFITNWTGGVSMPYEGDNRYKVAQSGNALSQGQNPGTAVVVYEFVNQTKQGEYIRSARYQNLTLSACP